MRTVRVSGYVNNALSAVLWSLFVTEKKNVGSRTSQVSATDTGHLLERQNEQVMETATQQKLELTVKERRLKWLEYMDRLTVNSSHGELVTFHFQRTVFMLPLTVLLLSFSSSSLSSSLRLLLLLFGPNSTSLSLSLPPIIALQA